MSDARSKGRASLIFYLNAFSFEIMEEHIMQELNYIRCGDYYIPDIRLPEEDRSIGRWGRMHRDYIKEHNPIRFNDLCLSGELWTYLADLNEQAQSRRGCDRAYEAARSDGVGWSHEQHPQSSRGNRNK